MTDDNRPLSPHLQVYRWQITSVLSFLHRLTGIALYVGSVVLVWWFVAAAAGDDYFELAQDVIGSWIGRLILLGWSWALFYHLANGIRHLFWDAGYGYELRTAAISGWIVVVASFALTVLSWAIGYVVLLS